MDRRHGKRPLPPEASEEKEKEHDDFPSYASTWSETDMSAMVSALTQVMGTSNNNPTSVQSTQYDPEQSVVKDEPDQSRPVQDQGNGCIHIYVLCLGNFCTFIRLPYINSSLSFLVLIKFLVIIIPNDLKDEI